MERLHSLSQVHPFLIMAHRGFWGGNVLENSIESTQLALQAGADIVEVDACRSQDGYYYLFHDGEEAKLLAEDRPFSQWTAGELADRPLLNSIGGSSGKYVTALADYLAWLPQEVIINLDRSWPYFSDPAFWQVLRDSGKLDQLLIKAPVQETSLQAFSDWGQGAYFMPIISNQAQWQVLQAYPDLDMPVVEVLIEDAGSDTGEDAWLQAVKEDHLVLFNAEFLSQGRSLFLGLSDDQALFDSGQGNAWQQMLAKGADIIQTDWPNFLYAFREEIRRG